MNRTRERFNAKARQSTAGSHKKKGKRPNKGGDSSGTQESSNPNAEIVVPKTEEQKELDRKEKLKQEVYSNYISILQYTCFNIFWCILVACTAGIQSF